MTEEALFTPGQQRALSETFYHYVDDCLTLPPYSVGREALVHKEIERVVVAQGKEEFGMHIRTDFEKAVISGQIVQL